MKVYLLYKTDAWNSHDSEKVIAVCSSKKNAIVLAGVHAKENEECLSEYDVNMLNELNITMNRQTNYLIEAMTIDEL